MHRLSIKFCYLFLVAAILLPLGSFAQGNINLPALNLKEYKLKNGLTVILHQDRTIPIAAINVFYQVGSKNEVAGRTGFAHLFEHMMFQGSKNFSGDYGAAFTDMGGGYNGSTTKDRTMYIEVVPSNFLERVLYLEADRMGGLPEAMTQEKLDNQRDVVKNERRSRLDNQPYGTAQEKIDAILFPEGHPYHWSPIGSMKDLSAASLEDVKSFFRTYYVPNNAILTIAGDFDETQVRGWIEKYFGPIARGAEIKRPNPEMPTLNGEIRQTVEDSVPLPQLYLVWHSVPAFSADEAALDMLGNILTSSRGSRLQSSLVYGKELAQQVIFINNPGQIGGTFQLQAQAKPGKSLAELEKAINDEIERIKQEPPTADEMTRALNDKESAAIYRLQYMSTKAVQISNYANFLKKPDFFQADLDRYRQVTAADIQRVARKYLNGNRLVMSFVPRTGEAPKANAEDNKPTSTSEKKIDEALLAKQKAAFPKPGPDPKFSLPRIEKTKLSNGLNVSLIQQNELPIVSMSLVINAGGTFDPADKSGVSVMTAKMLDRGTMSRSALDIANGFQSIGATVYPSYDLDAVTFTMKTLTKNLDSTLGIYSDVIVNPTFPADELEITRRSRLGELLRGKATPFITARMVFNKVLYGNQTYGRDPGGDQDSVKSITREDLVNFYQTYYHPNNATLIVVGNIDRKTLLPKLEKSFANWKSGQSPAVKLEAQTMKGKPGIYMIDKPGAAQSTIFLGEVGTTRQNPDYFALSVLNSILGEGLNSRLNKNLREDKGYTYGASSSFLFMRGAGPFRATGEIQTVSTKEAIVEFIKEINGIRGAIPVTAQELENKKQAIIRDFPRQFETLSQRLDNLINLAVYELPDSYYNDYPQKINAVTAQDINRVANQYLDPAKMAIVIVGDRKVIESRLKELNMPITILDSDGNPGK